MTTLADAITELDPNLSHADVLTALKARTITEYGLASGAEISGVLLSAGLLSLIEDQKAATGEHTPLRNICLALRMRFLPDGQVDLGNASNVGVLDAFLTESAVTSLLAAASTDAATVKTAIMALGQVERAEFPNIRLIDVVRARA